MRNGKRYYVFSSALLDSISHRCFKSDREAVKWFKAEYGERNGVSLYRFSSSAMNIHADKRLA